MKGIRRMAALLLAVTATGCADLVGDTVIRGSGPVLTEERSAARFYEVSNGTVADVEILQGPEDRYRVRAQESLLPYLRTRVSGGVLRIYTEPGVTLSPTDRVVVELDAGLLERIESSGSGSIHAPLLDAYRLEVSSSGSGDIRLPSLYADTLIVSSSGSGDVIVSGSVLRSRLQLSGAGEVQARELASNVVQATMSGSGAAVVRARDVLRATLSGSGWLRYYGSPNVQQTVTGAGQVQRAGS